MPAAPLTDVAEPATATDTSVEDAFGSAEGGVMEVPAGSALHLVRPSLPPVPVADVVTPPGPTARIHWVGSFVHLRQPADLYADIVVGAPNLVVVDARFREAFAREHLPGAVNLPPREIDERSTAHLSRRNLYVVYCWDASCRASTKTADRLAALGFRTNELHGGLQAWKKQGYPTERG
jgi:rhodanese-related sulfurtransferase